MLSASVRRGGTVSLYGDQEGMLRGDFFAMGLI